MDHGKDPHFLLVALTVMLIIDLSIEIDYYNYVSRGTYSDVNYWPLNWNWLLQLCVWRNDSNDSVWVGWMTIWCASKLEPTRSFENEWVRDYLLTKKLVKDQSDTHPFYPSSPNS